MAKFKSKYASLSVYHKGRLLTFSNGQYVTDDKDEIAVLQALRDVEQADEQTKQPEAEKPAPKAPAKRTASAK